MGHAKCYNIIERIDMRIKTRKGNKKIALILVLRALELMSDEKHPIKQMTLAKMINDMGAGMDSEIWCDRKTVGRHIDLLIAAGYDIVKVRGKGCYLRTNKFSRHESEALISIIKSADIEDKYKRFFIRKLRLQQKGIDEDKLCNYLNNK